MKGSIQMIAVALAAGLLLFPAGCMTSARKLERDAVTGQLHSGQTQAEVRQLLGSPKRSEAGSNGKTLDVFMIVTPVLAASVPTTEVRSVYALYDATGRLERFTWYAGESRGLGVGSSEQWRAGHAFSTDDLNHIERNVTDRDKLIQLFGPPTIEGLDVYGFKIISWVSLRGRGTSLLDSEELVVRLNGKGIAVDYVLHNVQP